MMLFIAVSLLAASALGAAENCKVCHRLALKGVHARLACGSCHGDGADTAKDPAAAASRAQGCTGCHQGHDRLFDHAMATRAGEKQFVARSWGKGAPRFWEKNCNSCHLRGCLDCHGGSGHAIGRPTGAACLTCHRGYFVGADFYGMAPREENLRYQRGAMAFGETFLTMTPDLHAEAGLTCGACHTMQSLAAGKKAAKGCRDCHRVRRTVVEHRISAHLEKMECYACHSAWGAQEYGTFYLRFTDSPSRQQYRLRENSGDYVKSVYLRKQDAPPLGVNAAGRVSPIRPAFIAFFSDIRNDRPVGAENRLLAAEWRAFFPHTVRRGTVMCEGCHDNPRRFVMEREEDRIHLPEKDGMTLPSFWERSGQRVVNGDFLAVSRYLRMTAKSPAYRKAYVEKWQSLVGRVEHSSAP